MTKKESHNGSTMGINHYAINEKVSKTRLNVTIGSALDLFGGPLNFEQVVKSIARE